VAGAVENTPVHLGLLYVLRRSQFTDLTGPETKRKGKIESILNGMAVGSRMDLPTEEQ